MSVAHPTRQRGRIVHVMLRAIHVHVIIAEPVHLGKANGLTTGKFTR
jgi:hypothetical protein